MSVIYENVILKSGVTQSRGKSKCLLFELNRRKFCEKKQIDEKQDHIQEESIYRA